MNPSSATPTSTGSHAAPRESSWVSLLLLATLCAAGAGALLSAAVAWAEIELNGYWELGYRRSAFGLLRAGLMRGLLGGALVGLAYALMVGFARSALVGRMIEGLARRAWSPVTTAGLAIGAFACPLALLLGLGRISSGSQRGMLLIAVAAWVVVGMLAAVAVLVADLPAAPEARRARRAFARVVLPALALCALAGALVNLGELSNLDHYVQRTRNARLALASACVLLASLPAAWAAARRVRGSSSTRLGLVTPIAASVPLALTLIVGLGRSSFERPTRSAQRPRNVLLIAIDTLRHDHTSFFREDERGKLLTPHLASLMQEGTRFSHAVSQSPWTLPAFSSIVTGRYPIEHGALNLFAELDRSELTIGELLYEAGYTTAAAVSHKFVDREHGFAQGIEDFREHHVGDHFAISSRSVTDNAIEVIEQHDGSQPLFLFTHYFDPHYEYRDHAGYDFADDYDGWLDDGQLAIRNLIARRHQLDQADVQHLVDRYDEEIAYTDAQIGRLIRALKDKGTLDDTAIVIVADHGEEFLEHGWIGHTITLYDEVIRVPLAVVLPGVDQLARWDVPVETKATFATLVDYLGLELPEGAQRDSLLPFIDGSITPEVALRGRVGNGGGDDGEAGAAGPRPVFSLVWMPNMPAESTKRIQLVSVRRGQWKLIRDVTRGRVELYDLAADPGERNDLSSEQSDRVSELQSLIDLWLELTARLATKSTRRLSEKDLQELRALGYF